MRDLLEYLRMYNVGVGLISLDQEKAFDRVDHQYLFHILKCFGLGDNLISWLKVLYKGSVSMIKIGGGLSVPVKIQKGIRQGCPMSGQLYSLAIEPLLCLLRRKLNGLTINGSLRKESIILSAYADDITVIVQQQEDILNLKESLKVYERALSARLNWDKTEAVWYGSTENMNLSLPNNIQWGTLGLKYLGVYLGQEEYK